MLSSDQRFLRDPRLASRIAEYAQLTKDDIVLEIGAGKGILTRELALRAGEVIAIEIDPRLVRILKSMQIPNLRIIQGDALKLEFPEFTKVVSNLPYSISSQISFKLLEEDFQLGILMYQKEFARRLVASPGSKDYGRLSVMAQLKAQIQILEYIPGSAFSPRSRVSSALVKLVPRKLGIQPLNYDFFSQLVKAGFSYRRKLLRNALLESGIVPEYISDHIPSVRAEQLSPEDWVELSNKLWRIINQIKSPELS